MKTRLLLLLFFPLAVFSQVDTLPPPPAINEVQVGFSVIEDTDAINVRFSDSIISTIKYISLVQLRPSCPDSKKRKTIAQNSKKRKHDCYMESTVITDLKKVPKIDSLFMIESVHSFEEYRFYKEKSLDSSEYDKVLNATFSSKRSGIITACYIPRHAVLFKDSVNNLIGIYEICFECGNAQLAIDYVDFISVESSDYKIIKDLFIRYKFIKPKKK